MTRVREAFQRCYSNYIRHFIIVFYPFVLLKSSLDQIYFLENFIKQNSVHWLRTWVVYRILWPRVDVCKAIVYSVSYIESNLGQGLSSRQMNWGQNNRNVFKILINTELLCSSPLLSFYYMPQTHLLFLHGSLIFKN